MLLVPLLRPLVLDACAIWRNPLTCANLYDRFAAASLTRLDEDHAKHDCARDAMARLEKMVLIRGWIAALTKHGIETKRNIVSVGLRAHSRLILCAAVGGHYQLLGGKAFPQDKTPAYTGHGQAQVAVEDARFCPVRGMQVWLTR